MKHQTVDQLRVIASVRSEGRVKMSTHEKLNRWAELLDQQPGRQLRTLRETEFLNSHCRANLRGDGSAIAVALADPVLQGEGLQADTYGEAKRFFDLTDRQMHEIICYCRFGETAAAAVTARAIRRIVARANRPGWFDRVRQWFSGPAYGR